MRHFTLHENICADSIYCRLSLLLSEDRYPLDTGYDGLDGYSLLHVVTQLRLFTCALSGSTPKCLSFNGEKVQ